MSAPFSFSLFKTLLCSRLIPVLLAVLQLFLFGVSVVVQDERHLRHLSLSLSDFGRECDFFPP